ncbi:TPA: hypothetical protein MD163_005095 [Klebsiella aerogenes]|nr:hypothetical protein [Klebsiella aerogenes]
MRDYRVIDRELLALPRVPAEVKLLYTEIAGWFKFYSERNVTYALRLPSLNKSLGIYLHDIIHMLIVFVEDGVIEIEDTPSEMYVKNVMPIEDFIKYLSK